MKLYWKLLILSLLGSQLVHYTVADFDDDDEGIVEDEQDSQVMLEKPRYVPPSLNKKPFMAETFDDKDSYKKKWTVSQAKKDDVDVDIAKYDGKWSLEEPKDASIIGDFGLVLKSKAKHHAVSAKLNRPYEFKGNPFIVSYEVKFQNGMDCGGAYIKLLSKTDKKMDLKSFHDKTPYTVMFGPDKCGLDHKLHFIFRHKNPITGEFEEKHAKKPSGKMDKYFTDKKTHLYTLIVNADNTFEVLVDNNVINSGSLLEDLSPPVNPAKEIDDPNDKKPEDWDEREQIADPDAVKPEDWDESQPMEIVDENAVRPDGWLVEEEPYVPDAEATKPSDWDDEMDGEWEAPLIDNEACKDAPGCGEWTQPSIPNPLYKGYWSAPKIDNPTYQGEWKPRRIENPHWFEDENPYKMTSIDALGLELWSMTDDIIFDNFIITDDRELHSSWVEQTFTRTVSAESSSGVGGIWKTLMDSAEERPWLYAVYIVVFLLPIVLLSICLCPRSGPIKQEDLDAARKKTDEATEDDTPDVPGPAGDNKKTTKKSKAALEQEEEDEEEEGEELSQEEEEQQEEEEAESTSKDSPRRSPRKRRTRKD